jgi:hypothetical protein
MTTDTRRRPPAETLRADTDRMATAWQDSFQTLLAGYRAQFSRFGALSSGLVAGFPWFDPERARASFDSIVDGTRDVAAAQVAVADELLRVPFWLTGTATPANLQQSYDHLLAAQRALFLTYVDSITGWQRTVAAAAGETVERTAATLDDAIDSQAEVAARVTRDVTRAQSAAVDVARTTAETVRATAERTTVQAQETVGRALDQAHEVVEDAADEARRETAAQRRAARERAERAAAEQEARQRLARDQAKAERAQEREQAEQARARLAARVIKGNVNRAGEKIYHLPGQANYDSVQAEETFETETQAQAAGYRRSQAAGGGTIKGKLSREGEQIYHLPGQANYDRIEADQLFETEEQAQANGFRVALR